MLKAPFPVGLHLPSPSKSSKFLPVISGQNAPLSPGIPRSPRRHQPPIPRRRSLERQPCIETQETTSGVRTLVDRSANSQLETLGVYQERPDPCSSPYQPNQPSPFLASNQSSSHFDFSNLSSSAASTSGYATQPPPSVASSSQQYFASQPHNTTATCPVNSFGGSLYGASNVGNNGGSSGFTANRFGSGTSATTATDPQLSLGQQYDNEQPTQQKYATQEFDATMSHLYRPPASVQQATQQQQSSQQQYFTNQQQPPTQPIDMYDQFRTPAQPSTIQQPNKSLHDATAPNGYQVHNLQATQPQKSPLAPQQQQQQAQQYMQYGDYSTAPFQTGFGALHLQTQQTQVSQPSNQSIAQPPQPMFGQLGPPPTQPPNMSQSAYGQVQQFNYGDSMTKDANLMQQQQQQQQTSSQQQQPSQLQPFFRNATQQAPQVAQPPQYSPSYASAAPGSPGRFGVVDKKEQWKQSAQNETTIWQTVSVDEGLEDYYADGNEPGKRVQDQVGSSDKKEQWKQSAQNETSLWQTVSEDEPNGRSNQCADLDRPLWGDPSMHVSPAQQMPSIETNEASFYAPEVDEKPSALRDPNAPSQWNSQEPKTVTFSDTIREETYEMLSPANASGLDSQGYGSNDLHSSGLGGLSSQDGSLHGETQSELIQFSPPNTEGMSRSRIRWLSAFNKIVAEMQEVSVFCLFSQKLI
jgi:hypothetical protein